MYLYYDNKKILKAQLNHGEQIRQNGDFSLYICFEKDFFEHLTVPTTYPSATLELSFLLPDNETVVSRLIQGSGDNVDANHIFKKKNDAEMTFGLVNGKKYICFKYYSNRSIDHITDVPGNVKLQIAISYPENDESVLVNVTSAILYVEPTIDSNDTTTPTVREYYEEFLANLTLFSNNKKIKYLYFGDKTEFLDLSSQIDAVLEEIGEDYLGWILTSRFENVDENYNSYKIFISLEQDKLYILDTENNNTYYYNNDVLIPLNIDIRYQNKKIQKRVNGEYVDVVDIETLKADMDLSGVDVERIQTIEGNVDEAMQHIANKNNPHEVSKAQVGLGNVENYGVEATPTIAGSNLYITSQGVKLALNELDNRKADNTEFQEAKAKLEEIYALLGETDGDADNIVNKIREVLAILEDYPEGQTIIEKLELKADKTTTDELEGRIIVLEQAQSNCLIIMPYEDNQDLFTIEPDDWIEDEEETYSLYPYVATIHSPLFVDCVSIEVVFDAETAQNEGLASIQKIDKENGIITFYIDDIPSDNIVINRLKVINSLAIIQTISQDALAKIEANKQDINAINNVKLPLIENEVGEKQGATDNTLETTDKTIVGAINELNGKIHPRYIHRIKASYSVTHLPSSVDVSTILYITFETDSQEEVTTVTQIFNLIYSKVGNTGVYEATIFFLDKLKQNPVAETYNIINYQGRIYKPLVTEENKLVIDRIATYFGSPAEIHDITVEDIVEELM